MGPNTPKVLLAVNVMTLIAVTIGFRVYVNQLSSEKMKPEHGIRYILLYNDYHDDLARNFGRGRDAFVREGCPHANCFVVHDRFSLPMGQYDAIVFYGASLRNIHVPKQRSKGQKYIYYSLESADNFPVCNESFDEFFDLTVSYRLDSDITQTYFRVVDTEGAVVAPAKKVHWLPAMKSHQQFTSSALASKKRAAAWMVSHCDTNSKRDQVVTNLQNALLSLSDTPEATIDVYGGCGTLICSKVDHHRCQELLKKKYFFYLSFENSISEDYVTEKILTAVQNDLIPIVYGGADYSRFLPPDSYLDARQYSPRQLAHQMLRIMNNLTLFNSYFRWRSRYKIELSSLNVCDVCAAVNKRHTKRRHKSFRKWWLPQFKSYCPKKVYTDRKWWLSQSTLVA